MRHAVEPRATRHGMVEVLLGIALTATWLNPWSYGPSPAVPGMLLALMVLGVFLLCWRWWSASVLAWGWLLAALFSSLIGWCQYFGIEHYFAPWMSAAEGMQAYGNLRQRNQYATLTNIGLAALVFLALHVRRVNTRQQSVLLVGSVALAFGNAASSSRTGLVGLVLLLVWAAWLVRGERHRLLRHLLLTAFVAYWLGALLLPLLTGEEIGRSGILGRLQSSDLGCASRMTLWRNMLELISERPWRGWGWGELDYAHFMTVYEDLRQCEMLDNAHNLPLHLAVELGLPLALLLSAVCIVCIWRAQPWREVDPVRQLAWNVLALIGLHSMLEYPLWYGPFQLAAILSLLLLWRRPQTASQGGSVASCPGYLAHGLAAALLVVVAYAGWDYHRISQIYLPVEMRSSAYREHTLEKIGKSWLFRDQVLFAEFTLTPLTRDNAAQLNAMAHEMLHFSPEASVVEKLIESALMLGRDDEAHFFMTRYRVAYPKAYEHWLGEGTSAVK